MAQSRKTLRNKLGFVDDVPIEFWGIPSQARSFIGSIYLIPIHPCMLFPLTILI
jgi:hypothetical protein